MEKRFSQSTFGGPSADEKEESVHYLDLAAIVRDRKGSIPDRKFVYDGIEVVVSYWHEQSFLQRAKEFDESWPAYRTRYSNLIVLYDRDDWTRHVKTALGESDKADSTDAIRVTALDMVRHIGILGDDIRKGDPREIREDCDALANVCLNLLFLLNHKPYPTGDFWKGISEFPIKPADLLTLVDSAKGNIAVGQKAMAEAAMRLAQEMLEMVRLRGIAIESAGPLV